MKADRLPSGAAGLPPVSLCSCRPSRCMQKRGWLQPRKAPEPQNRAGEATVLPGPARASLELWRLSRGAVGTGVAPRCIPESPDAHLLQAALGVRRGASGDQLLSLPPLYSGSIRRGAAYAPYQSRVSRSRSGRPGGGRRICGGRNRRIDSCTWTKRDWGSGRTGERTDRQSCIDRRTGGRREAGEAGPEEERWPGRRLRRSPRRGARPPPAGDPRPHRPEPPGTEGRGWSLGTCRSLLSGGVRVQTTRLRSSAADVLLGLLSGGTPELRLGAVPAGL